MGSEKEILEKVAEQTHSELILFFILVVVALVVVLIPLYRMVSQERKERREAEAARTAADNEAANIRQDKYIEREKQIIQVITANTEVMAGLKATFTEVVTGLKSSLEASGAATTTSLGRIHDRIDDQNTKVNELCSAQARMETTMSRVIDNQSSMIDRLNKVLLIVDNIPNNSNFSGKGGQENGS